MLKLFQDKARSSHARDVSIFGIHGASSAAQSTLEILEKITEGIASSRSMSVCGTAPTGRTNAQTGHAGLESSSALREMLEGGSEIAVGEAYLREAFDVEGDMVAAFELADILAAQTGAWTRSSPSRGCFAACPISRRATDTSERAPPD